MELELKIVADNPRELIKIAAKLSDLDVTLKDDIPFMPEDLMSDGNLINSNEEFFFASFNANFPALYVPLIIGIIILTIPLS